MIAARAANACLKDLVTLQRGFDITKAEQEPGPYPVVSSSGIKSLHSTFKVSGPGVVVGRKGSLGTVFYVRENFWPHDTTLWVKDFHGNDERYSYYFLQTMQLEQYDVGASNPTLNRNHIHGLPIYLPSLPTQRRIASILSAYDDLIENNTRRIAVLEEMARRLYEEWFVHFRFPGHEDVPFTETEDGRVPEGWDVVRLHHAIDFNPRTKVPKEGEKLFVPMGALSETGMNVGPLEYKSGNSGAKFQNGDTLFARITPCLENGKTGFVDFLPPDQPTACGSTEFIVLRSKTLCPEMVYLLSRSDHFRDVAIKSMAGADGRQRVRKESLEELMIAQPDDAVLERFHQVTEPMFKFIGTLSSKNANLRTQRDLLLPKLVSGEIDVSEADKSLEATE